MQAPYERSFQRLRYSTQLSFTNYKHNFFVNFYFLDTSLGKMKVLLYYLVHFGLSDGCRDAVVGLGQVVGELLVGRLGEDGLLPQIGGQVGVGLGDGGVGSLG